MPPLDNIYLDNQNTRLVGPHHSHDYGSTEPGRDTHTDAADGTAHSNIPEHVILAISEWVKINKGEGEIGCETDLGPK